jgi:hypothetical protein
MIPYPSQDGTQINAYLSRPAAAGRYPGVVVINEDSPQQATGYQKENRLLMRNHGFSNSSL